MFDNRPTVKLIPSTLDRLGVKHWSPVVSIHNSGPVSDIIPVEVQALLAEKGLKPCIVPNDGSPATLGFERVS
jgi:hypothetical protein